MRRLSLLLLVCGCSVQHPTVYESVKSWSVKGPVALEVDDTAVTKSEFETYWRRHPDLTRAQVSEALTVRQALVVRALADRRGGAAKFDMARKRGLVETLLEREVETVTAAPPKDTFRFKKILSRPAGFRVSTLVVRPPADDTPVDYDALKPMADAIRTELPDDATALDLLRMSQVRADGARISVDLHLVFPKPSDSSLGKPKGWVDVVPDFAEAVESGFAARQHMIGPVKSEFGWHIVILEEQLPGKVADDSAIKELAQRVAIIEARQERLRSIVAEELKNQRWAMYPAVLDKENL